MEELLELEDLEL